MAKCRTLQEENEEIGAMTSEGKVSPLILLPYNSMDMLSDIKVRPFKWKRVFGHCLDVHLLCKLCRSHVHKRFC
jgi:hypothetical protein